MQTLHPWPPFYILLVKVIIKIYNSTLDILLFHHRRLVHLQLSNEICYHPPTATKVKNSASTRSPPTVQLFPTSSSTLLFVFTLQLKGPHYLLSNPTSWYQPWDSFSLSPHHQIPPYSMPRFWFSACMQWWSWAFLQIYNLHTMLLAYHWTLNS